MYHGNVINNGNCEIHKFRRPELIYYQRLSDVMDCWKSNAEMEQCPRIHFSLDEQKVNVSFDDISERNAPVKYAFELIRNQ